MIVNFNNKELVPFGSIRVGNLFIHPSLNKLSIRIGECKAAKEKNAPLNASTIYDDNDEGGFGYCYCMDYADLVIPVKVINVE